MRGDLGEGVEGREEEDLARLLREGRGRLKVRRREVSGCDLPVSRCQAMQDWWRGVDLSRWAWAEKWWLLVLVLAVVCTATVVSMIVGGCVIIVGTVWTLALGREVRSRWLVFMGFFVVGTVFCFVFV